MKLLSTILIVLMLVLLVQPVCGMTVTAATTERCCETDQDCGDQDNSREADDDCNGCNPFQCCSCCVNAVLIPEAVYRPEAKPATTIDKRKVQMEFPALLSAESPGVWQPPRQA